MIQAFGMARLGRDVELRYTQNGEAVASLSLAFTYGRKGEDGRRPTTWVDGSLWGKRAEALAPYLLKGLAVAVCVEDLHIEVYQGKNGEGTKLTGRVVEIELGTSPNTDTQANQPAPREQQRNGYPARPPLPPARAPARAPAPAQNFDDMDSDIPF